MPTAVFQTSLPVSSAELASWHFRPGAFERLLPPWERLEILQPLERIEEGAVLVMKLKFGPFGSIWEALHTDIEEGRQFRDLQRRGPFARWEHTHRFLDGEGGGSLLEDSIEYALPIGRIGEAVAGGRVKRLLERMFAFRHRRTREDLQRHSAFADRPRLKIAISGASGLLGKALSAYLSTAGHQILPIVRKAPKDGKPVILWEPSQGRISSAALEGLDAVIHLSGESVAQRWTAQAKAEILESRTKSTGLLAKTLASLKNPPKAFLSASAIGWYGDRPFEEVLTEESPTGQGFLPEVCQAWEAHTQAAEDAGLRVCRLRIGVVLTAAGGALPQMALPIRWGVGGRVGSGKQAVSWIAQDDILGAIEFLLHRDDLSGAFNLTSPEAATHASLTAALGRVLRRPTFAPVPAAAIRLLFGEMGQELLLEGSNVAPQRLLHAGFSFLRPHLEDTLRYEFGV